MKYLILFFLSSIWIPAFSQLPPGMPEYFHYIVINKQKKNNAREEVLNGKETMYKILNINYMVTEDWPGNFLIHFVVFSNEKGEFNKKIIEKNELLQYRHTSIDSIVQIAEINVRRDQQRGIDYFEFEPSGQGSFFIKSNVYKLAIENNDGTYSIYNNKTNAFFYEIRDYKQFVPVQSCASLINTKSILQAIPRMIAKNGEPEVANLDSSFEDYFSNKLFLEKINVDSSFHFIRYGRLCMDCSENYDFEFDFNRQKGITRFWYYLPKKINEKGKYVLFH